VGSRTQPSLRVGPRQWRVRRTRADGVDTDAALEESHALPCDVGADRLLRTHVARLRVIDHPLRSLVVVMDVENLREQLEVPLPAHAGRRRDEANRASARDLIVREELLDQVAVADEVDPLDTRSSFIDAGTREHRMDSTAARADGALDRAALREVELDGRRTLERHRGTVHHDELGAALLCELRRGRPHPRGAAHHQHPLAVITKRIKQSHHTSLESDLRYSGKGVPMPAASITLR